jgi:hypothetical protein
MDEADKSLIATLSSIGVPFDGLTSLSKMEVEPFIKVVTFCINKIAESTCVWARTMSHLAQSAAPARPALTTPTTPTYAAHSEFRAEFPGGLAARHQLGTRLGKRVKNLGFQGEAGYNQFLYPNDKFVRKLMMWLLTEMPKPEQEEVEETEDAAATLQASINKKLSRWARGRWRPACARTEASVVRRVHAVSLNVAQVRGVAPALRAATATYHATHLHAVSLQPADPADAPASLLQLNALQLMEARERERAVDAGAGSTAAHHRSIKDIIRAGIASSAYGSTDSGGGNSLGDVLNALSGRGGGGGDGSAFERASTFAGGDADDVGSGGGAKSKTAMTAEEKEAEEKAEEERRVARVAKLKKQLEKMKADTKDMVERKGQLVNAARQREAQLAARKAKSKELEGIALVKQKTLQMLPEADMHKKRLNALCQKSATQLLQLGQQWEKSRRPLVLTARRLKESSARRKIESVNKVQDMRRMREEMRGMAAQLRAKEAKLVAMHAEYKKLPKGIDRGQCVRMFLFIIPSASVAFALRAARRVVTSPRRLISLLRPRHGPARHHASIPTAPPLGTWRASWTSSGSVAGSKRGSIA